MKKTCFKCGRLLNVSEFYSHSATKDGLLGKCKNCTKIDVLKRARENPDKIREYELARSKRPDRKILAKMYLQKYRKEHPERNRQNLKVQRAIHNGIIKKPEHCSICGKKGKTIAHHSDYSKPLDVIFVCQSCHKKIHYGTL